MKEKDTNETKKCKHCQTDIPKKAKVCPNCRKKQKTPVLGIAIAVIGVFILIGAFSESEDEKPEKVSSNTSSSITGSTESEIESTLSESEETFGIGDTAEYKNVKVTLNSIQESNGSEFNKPTSGNVFLLVNFTIENNSDTDLAVSSMLSFTAYQDGYSTNISFSALMEKDGEQLDGTIAPGKKMQGSIGYEIPEDYTEFEINYQADVWDDNKFTFVYTKE